MSRCIAPLSFATILATVAPAIAASSDQAAWPDVVQVKSFEELSQKWCDASRDSDYVFVLPASLFVDGRQVICDSGTYKLYRTVPADDTGDYEYHLVPPFGKANVLGCDGKAGLKVETVAINCRPQ
jgi:hypothetical protein